MSGNGGQLPHGAAGNMGMNNNAMAGVGNQQQYMQQQLQAMQAQMQQQLAIMRRQQAQIQTQRAQLAQQQGGDLDVGESSGAPGSGGQGPSSQGGAVGGGSMGNMPPGLLAQQLQQQQSQQPGGMNSMSGMGGIAVGGGQFGAGSGANASSMSQPPGGLGNSQGMTGAQSGAMVGLDPSSSSKNAMLLQQLQFQKLQQMQQQQQSQQRNGGHNGMNELGGNSGGASAMNLSMMQNQQSLGGAQGMPGANTLNSSGGMNPLAAMQNMQNNMSHRGSAAGSGISQMGMNGPSGQSGGASGIMSQDNPSMLGLQNQGQQGLGGMGNMMGGVNQRHSSAAGSESETPQSSGHFPAAVGNQSNMSSNNPLLQLQQQQQQFLAMQQQMQQAQHSSRRSVTEPSQSPGVGVSNKGAVTGHGMGSGMGLGIANRSSVVSKGGSVGTIAIQGMDMTRASLNAGNVSSPANPNGPGNMMSMIQQQGHGGNGSAGGGGPMPPSQFMSNPMGNASNRGPGSLFSSQSGTISGSHDTSKPGTPSLSNPTPNNAPSSDDVSVSDFSSTIPSALPDFAGGWQSNADLPDRRRVIVNIVKIIERMRPDANKMAIRLPLMAKKLEEHLYRSAATKAEYIDSSTLKRRLQLIAHRLGLARSSSSGRDDDSVGSGLGGPGSGGADKKARKIVPTVESAGSSGGDPQSTPATGRDGSSGAGSGYSGQAAAMMKMNSLQRELAQQGMLLNHAQASTRGTMLNQSQRETLMRQLENQQQQLQSLLSQAGGNGGGSGVNDLIEMSRLVAKQKAQLHAMQERNGSAGQSQMQGIGAQNSASGSQGPNGMQMTASTASGGVPQMPGMPNMMSSHSTKSSDPRSQREKVVRQQQQRLLLLRHASKCSAGPNCKTQFCAEMVKLWQHMKQCRDKNCQTAHCLSSRCVLHHYRICKGEGRTSTCEVCAPVMKQIKWQSMSSGESDGIDLMEQLAKEQADQDHADDNGSVNSLSSLRSSIANQSKSGTGKPQLPKNQIQALHKQQHGMDLSGDVAGSNGSQGQGQESVSAQALSRNMQALQQQAGQNFPLSEQQQRQQAALLQQLQEQQQNFLMQLQRKSGNPGDTASDPNANNGKGLGLNGPDNAFTDPFDDGATHGDIDDAGKAKLRRSSSQSSRKRKPEVAPGVKATKRGGKGKRMNKAKKEHEEGDGIASADPFAGGSKSTSPEVLEADEDALISHDAKLEAPAKDGSADSRKSASKKEGESVSVKKNQANVNAVNCMDTEQIQKHIDSLSDINNLSPRRIAQKCTPIVNKLINDPNGWVFKDPVDPVELGIPDYFEVIKHPMDLSLVKKRLENGSYKHLSAFESDTKLVFQNCIVYNGEDSDVGEMAKGLLSLFEKEFQGVVKGFKPDTRNIKGDVCTLCEGSRKQFEPTVLYCNGACGMQRIRRNTFYYTDVCKQNHWCSSCFEKLKDNDPIMLDDNSEIRKKDLQKLKNDALAEEGWVSCDKCDAWIHQICALFNGRKNKSSAQFICPKCIIKERKKSDEAVVIPKCPQAAVNLPQNALSRYLEDGLSKALEKAYAETGKERKVPPENVEKAEGLSVRVVSNLEKKHHVRDEMFKRYEGRDYASEFPVRTKCILLFQTVHGVDILLFGMYVYEYDSDCPAPNKRRVYISYLDSVQFFEPREYRTMCYHTILIEYLRYVKSRGFHTAHIWSCPPSKGDDYIFHIHPSSQKTPRDDMLCMWYQQMLDRAQKEGVVLQTKSLHDEYFKPDPDRLFSADYPTCLPYFEGDYLPGELENIIKDVNKTEEDRREKKEKTSSSTHKRKDSSGKPAGKKKGTRSNPGDLVGVKPDKVMLRFGQAMSNMQQNFFVVYLRSREFAHAVDRGDDVSNWTENEASASGDVKLVKNGKKDIALDVAIGNTSDVDAPIESELFDSRQQFLNYCQTNHYQFDETRRAKHTTMMVLYHMHDPAAPKFLSQCGACYREITHGVRYHCESCSNFDLCDECYKPVTTGLWARKDKRFAHDDTHNFTPIDMETPSESMTQRQENRKSIKASLELLEHCGTCPGRPTCTLSNCPRMRGLFTHLRTCKLTYRKGCKTCSRFIALLSMHAKQCSVRHSEHCKIPFCDPIRERNYRLRQQQQLMDDRRRAAQNKLYRGGSERKIEV